MLSAPLSGKFVCELNGIEKKIILKQAKGDYAMNGLKNKVIQKFESLQTKDFQLKIPESLVLIQSDDQIIQHLLGQSDPLPKCTIFVEDRIPRFDSAVIDSHINDITNEHRHAHRPNHPIDLKSIVSKHDIYQGQKEYILRFENQSKKCVLTMADIAKFTQNVFIAKFDDLFEHECKQNEQLSFKVYHIETGKYVAMRLPLWSYDSEHYSIEVNIKQKSQTSIVSNTQFQLEPVLNCLESNLKSKQNELGHATNELCKLISEKNGSIHSLDLWKKYQKQIDEMDREIAMFCNHSLVRLNKDFSTDLQMNCNKLKAFCDSKLNEMNELQRTINNDENEICHISKLIFDLKSKKKEFETHLKGKQIEMKKEESLWNKSVMELEQLQSFSSKYESIKKKLNKSVTNFEKSQKQKMQKMQKTLNSALHNFESNFESWTIEELLQWILCIENFHFSDEIYDSFIETLKTHKVNGTNMKELKSNFTLNVMGLKDEFDQTILQKHVIRVLKQKHITHAHKPFIKESKTTNHCNQQSSVTTVSSMACIICVENEINTVVIPCGHMVMCSECSVKCNLKVCPTCRCNNIRVITCYRSGL